MLLEASLTEFIGARYIDNNRIIIYYILMRRRDDNKKEAIFQATKELLTEIGFSDTSMSKIAKRAGVSAATIYVYFDNKDDMLRKLYLDVKEKLAASIVQAIDQSMPVREAMERSMQGYLHFILDNRVDYLFLEQFSNSPLLQNLCIQDEIPSFASFQSIVEKGIREGILRQVDVSLVYLYCALPLAQLAKNAIKGNASITPEDLQTIYEMSWNAIRA